MSTQHSAILSLGKKLVDELGLDPSVDTLGRWMAHYVAELIHDAENAGPEDKLTRLDRCAAAVLDLWRHRAKLPDGMRPFEDSESIFRTIASLDPCDETPRYFSIVRAAAAAADVEPDTEAGKWLKLAKSIDSTAKELIRHCLACAAETAEDETEEWVALAEKAGQGDAADVRVLRILLEEAGKDDKEVEDEERNQIEARIERLEEFQVLAKDLAANLRSRLKQE